MDPDVSKDFGAFIFKIQTVEEEDTAGPLKIKAPRFFETSGTTRSLIQHHIFNYTVTRTAVGDKRLRSSSMKPAPHCVYSTR